MTALIAPAAERNRDPILGVLKDVLPSRPRVLEIASGTGQHAVYFTERLPEATWQPSDVSDESLRSIEAHRSLARLPGVLAPLRLDVTTVEWPPLAVNAVVCINMIHIAPWSACRGLFAHAARLLAPGQPVFLYGPYFRDGVENAPSNVEFDVSLKRRDPQWGVRRLEDVTDVAGRAGFRLARVVEMPTNNVSVVFFKS